MATKLTRPVRREVLTLRGSELIVTLTDVGLELREKRRRTAYLLPYGAAFMRAAELAADVLRRMKAEARRSRRQLSR